MNWAIKSKTGRILAACCVVLIVLLQVAFAVPSNATGKAGEELEIRVQYEGEPGHKIRTIAIFSNAELESLGAYDTQYVNITRVGTLMKTAAHVVDLDKIIYAAGIDLGSVKSFTFRATDGYTMTFSGADYLGAAGWYYPALGFFSSRVDIGDGYIQMEEGALDDASQDSFPALAIRSDSVKGFKVEPSFDDMDTSDSYRFLTGQTDLSYLQITDEDGTIHYNRTKQRDITAWDSVKYIYGIDVVLKGTPPLDGISLDVLGDDTKVGSQVQLQVTFKGDTLGIFSGSDVTWSSSDESIATVDENGVVTILQEKEVIITAEAGGRTASVTINGVKEENKDSQTPKDSKTQEQAESSKDKVVATAEAAKQKNKDNEKSKVDKKETKKENKKEDKKEEKKVLMAKEISIGKEVQQDPEEARASVSVKSDAQALEEVQSYDKGIVAGSAAAAILACGGGAVFRIRRFRIDLGQNIKSKK